MLILAADVSTRRGSVALLDGDDVREETFWKQDGRSHAPFFRELRALLQRAGRSPASVDGFAVGLGPGSFSGVRMSLTAFRTLALPGKRPVFGFSSSRALAWQVWEKTPGTPPISVIGDARRGTLWVVTYTGTPSGVEGPDAFTLVSPEDLADHVPRGAQIVSPDWSRIGGLLGERLAEHAPVLEGDHLPTARTIGRLAIRQTWQEWNASAYPSSDALVPIYLHPPV